MVLPRNLARFNRVVTNRVMGLWAGRIPPWAIVHHRGRRSGAAYETPVWTFATDHQLVVALTYGPESDWVRNVLAAGGATIERAGRFEQVRNVRLVGRDEGFRLLPSVVHPPLRALGVDSFFVADRA